MKSVWSTIGLGAGLALAVACGGADAPPTKTPTPSTAATAANTAPAGTATVAPAGSGTAGGPVSFGKNKPIVASELFAKLTEAKLDAKSLPALDKMSQKQLQVVMNTFTKALGWKCNDCHSPSSYTADHPMKNVTRKMWNEYVRGITFDGGQLYCDSCHMGKAEFLDKSDKKALAAWMDAEYTKRMKRNGQAQTCATCHGEPFKPEFIEDWKKK
jgi:hypothetical protein